MAALITHIVLAKKLYDKLHLKLDEGEFMVGTTFPDIRYLGVISREKTHAVNPDIETIKTSDAFKAGLAVHVLVDKFENDFSNSNIYSFYDRNMVHVASIKLLQDELLFTKLDGLDKYAKAFDKVYDKELDFGIPVEAIEKWHKLVKNYVFQKPSDDSRQKLLLVSGFPDDSIKAINLEMSQIRKNPQITSMIYKLYDDFLKSLEEL